MNQDLEAELIPLEWIEKEGEKCVTTFSLCAFILNAGQKNASVLCMPVYRESPWV